ncbi:MAG: AAA family ATPase [Chloroflexi bacterium]|nr:AAA family ATPase [Chloroflexota bacterium]
MTKILSQTKIRFNQMADVWRDRGAFPGLGSALEALGVRLGTALSYDLITHNILNSSEDPWPLVDAMLRGEKKPPEPEIHQPSLNAARKTWLELNNDRRALIKLLSRFDMLPEQARRWFDPQKRREACDTYASDEEILANPYQIAELDLGQVGKPPVAVSTIDRGLLPDSTIAAKYPVPEPSRVSAHLDPRRVRSVFVHVLRNAAEAGDALLSEQELLSRIPQVHLPHPCEVTSDWIAGNQAALAHIVDCFPIQQNESRAVSVLQLTALKKREDGLRSILLSRAKREVMSSGEDWVSLLRQTLLVQPHPAALEEQALALERITTRRLSVLTGRAGTGKTSTLGALLRSPTINRGGVLLLAPTGKARVRLNRAVGQDVALTIAQFLYRQRGIRWCSAAAEA